MHDRFKYVQEIFPYGILNPDFPFPVLINRRKKEIRIYVSIR